LVDTIGSFSDAIASAAKRAKLSKDVRISYIEREPSRFDRIFGMFGASVTAEISRQFEINIVPTGIPMSTVKDIGKDFTWLQDLQKSKKPYMTMTHCFCNAP